jgi:hypothetical protein
MMGGARGKLNCRGHSHPVNVHIYLYRAHRAARTSLIDQIADSAPGWIYFRMARLSPKSGLGMLPFREALWDFTETSRTR